MRPLRCVFKKAGYAILSVVAVTGASAALRPTVISQANDIPSFYMWCLDFQMYPTARCDARRAEDLKAYQQFRSGSERFDQERAARERRDQDLQKRLNPDPAGSKQQPVIK